MGLFSKDKPDSRLLRLDDQFTSAIKNEDTDPRGTMSKCQEIAARVQSIGGLSTKDDEYKSRLLHAIQNAIERLKDKR